MGNCFCSIFKSPIFYISLTVLTCLSLNVGINLSVIYLVIFLIDKFIPSYYYLKLILIPVLFLYNYLLLRRIVSHCLFEWQFPFQIFSIYKERQNYVSYLKERLQGFLNSLEVILNPQYKLTENEIAEITYFLNIFQEEFYIYDNLYNIVIADRGRNNNNLIRYKMSQNQINYYNLLKHIDNMLNENDLRNKLKQLNLLNNTLENPNDKENIINLKNLLNNEYLPIIEKYNRQNYTYMSPAYIYNLIFNDTFGSLSLYSLQFKYNFQEFLVEENYTSNGKIHYTLIRNIKDINNNLIEEKNEINIEENALIKENEKNDDGNLLFFCLPNGGCYELMPKSKLDFYLNNGFSFLCWNYRGYGFSKGSCDFSYCKDDALVVFDEVTKNRKYNFKKICVMGHSIGGLAMSHVAKNRKVDMIISDRNFCDIPRIAKNFHVGNLLSFLLKCLFIGNTNVIENFMDQSGGNNLEKINKIIIYSPSDALIVNDCTVKSGIARYVIKNYIFYNNIKSKDNFLDLIFNSNEKNVFLNNFIDLIHLNHDLALDYKNEIINSNDPIISTEKKFIGDDKNDISYKFFDKFFGICCDNLSYICENQMSIRRQKIFLENFFNNLLIWGAQGEEPNEEIFEFYSYKGLKIIKEASETLNSNNYGDNLIDDNNMFNRKILLLNNLKVYFQRILHVMQNLGINFNGDNKRITLRMSNLENTNYKEKLISTDYDEDEINTNNTNSHNINTKMELNDKFNLIDDDSNINISDRKNFYQKLNYILGSFKIFKTYVGHNGALREDEREHFYCLLLKSGIID